MFHIHIHIYKTISEICSLKEQESTVNFECVQVLETETVYLIKTVYKRWLPLTFQNYIC